MYPWEMMAHKKYSRTSFIGTSVGVSRQFRSLLAPRPSSPPPLNGSLNVLVIADPAPGKLSLPHAREEGFSVVEVLDQATRAWQGQYNIKATIRIGSNADRELEQQLKKWRERDWIVSAKTCDPLDIAMLIVSEKYDLIHYAGHGFCDQQTGRTGWVLDEHCCLSAQEIFRVRQVPRLVFANACFSSATPDNPDARVPLSEERKRLVGMARAFFDRGIPNFIGAGWSVDDACARECARWFYARVLGLSGPEDGSKFPSGPETISGALLKARSATYDFQQTSESLKASSTWGAYQHYGRVSDKLLSDAPSSSPSGDELPRQGRPAELEAIQTSACKIVPSPSSSGVSKMSMDATAAGAAPAAINPDLVYVNGIDPETGAYAVPPRSIEELAKAVRDRPGVETVTELHRNVTRFGLPFNVDFNKLEEAGWGIVFHEDTPQEVRAALAPLVAARRGQAKTLFKELDYKKGEQTRDWYQRQGISVGGMDPEIVPYYLLVVGPPDLIPFEFQYLLGIEYAVGRLAFDAAAEYEHYARSILAYETANSAPNAKEIVYWGTRHLGDGATNLSASFLVDPLANGIASAAGALKRPISAEVGYGQKLFLGDDATKETLLATLHAAKPPALLFTASHGMAIRPGAPNQLAAQGGLLCQDWPGYGSVRPTHFLAAGDVADDANVNGLIAFLFACFGGGTPDVDQFPMDLTQAGHLPPLAPKPFIAALPRRLLTHPKGSALAVVGHIDRAWGFSIQGPKTRGPQIGVFRNSLGTILTGGPVGHAVAQQFGGKFAELSATLLSAISPSTPTAMRPNDRDLVSYWLERNDAQNYVVLGDPAARIRDDLLT